MSNNKTRTVSTRITLEEMAKARDGLLAKGISPEAIDSNSAILRTSVLMACLLNDDPKSPASDESIAFIKQLWQLSKRTKNINLKDLY